MDEFNENKVDKQIIEDLIKTAIFDAIVYRIRYDALVRAGFSDEQAFELIKNKNGELR